MEFLRALSFLTRFCRYNILSAVVTVKSEVLEICRVGDGVLSRLCSEECENAQITR